MSPSADCLPDTSGDTGQDIADYLCEVVSNQDCGTNLKLLHLAIQSHRLPGRQQESPVFRCNPGQFVMLDLPTSQFYFRRPFSILDSPCPQEILIYYKRVGTGTQLMWDLEPGQHLFCLGALGNGFPSLSEFPASSAPLFIGGGIGIAPLLFQARRFHTTSATCLYGARSKTELGLLDALTHCFGSRNLHLSTDDGSAGIQGTVCDLLEKQPDLARNADIAYLCGPTVMMKATTEKLKQMNPGLIVYVSLEEHMPCGTGACSGCVTPRTDQVLPSKVCVEGPVFLASSIQWPEKHAGLSTGCLPVISCDARQGDH
jgi:dihydroorotate dehydrogenase electron transfer subunit